MCVPLSYFVTFLSGYPDISQINHSRQLLSALGLWTFCISMLSMATKYPSGLTRRPLWQYPTLPLGFIAMMISFFGAGAILSPELMPAKSLLITIYLSAIGFNILCIYTAWTRYTIEKGILLIKNDNTVLYPSDKLAIRLTGDATKFATINQSLKPLLFQIPVVCQDGPYQFLISTSAKLDLNLAKQNHLQQFNYKKFMDKIKQWITDFLNREQADSTSGQLVSKLITAMRGQQQLNQMPFTWKTTPSIVIQPK